MALVLTVGWDGFIQEINNLLKEARSILSKENSIKSIPDLEEIKTDIKNWCVLCNKYLLSSFETREFADVFNYTREQRYSMGNKQKDFEQNKKETFGDLKAKINFLDYNLKIFNVSDIITKPQVIDWDKRKSFTTEEILELILDKLFDLYDNYYHPILNILEGNGIVLKRHGEERELAKILEDNGYIKTTHFGNSTSAQLTINGKIYVEKKRQVYEEDYDDINKSQEEINKKIDEIIQELTKLGYGQEIIFDEIQELKDLYKTLNKKNWGQIVKGKLVDLALAKFIENDTLKFIYEKLTDHQLRLLDHII